jgi:hypothetical protein
MGQLAGLKRRSDMRQRAGGAPEPPGARARQQQHHDENEDLWAA